MGTESAARRSPGFAFVAIPVVVATSVRVAALDRQLGFGALLDQLRQRRVSPLPGWLAQPERLAATTEALLALLPPRSYGRCLRHALIVLELWSRCGLEPVLHLGFRLDAPNRNGHAWLTARTVKGQSLQVSGPLDSRPVFEL